MTELCTYCPEVASEPDHVPPRCFFAPPRPDLITVPACRSCNQDAGRDDERVRNLLVTLEHVQSHRDVGEHLLPKMYRSLDREEGGSNLIHLVDSIRDAEVWSEGGIYLGQGKGIDLDQPAVDRFLVRVAKGLLRHENGVRALGAVGGWRVGPTASQIERMSGRLKSLLLSGASREVGEGVFRYKGYFAAGCASSLWLMRFFEGLLFMVKLVDDSEVQEARRAAVELSREEPAG